MGIEDKFYEIIEKYDGSGEIDECVGEIEEMLDNNKDVLRYKTHSDTDVFDSCGLDIFYDLSENTRDFSHGMNR